MILLSVLLNVASAECSATVTLKELSNSLDAMSIGFANRDLPTLEQKIEESQTLLPCLQEQITPELAYRFHMLHGLYYWISQSPSKANQSFSIAKSIDPEKHIEYYLFPEDHSIHEVYANVPEVSFSEIDVPPSANTIFYFDGSQSTKRPTDNPTIFQIQNDQQIVLTQYLSPYTDIPIYTPLIEEAQKQPKDNTSVTQSPTPAEIPTARNSKKYIFLGAAGISLAGSYGTAIPLRNKQEQDLPLWIGNQVFFISFLATSGYSALLFWKDRKSSDATTTTTEGK